MKKFIVTASAIGALAFSVSAFAEEGVRAEGGVKINVHPNYAIPTQMQVSITPQGEANLRGVVTAVNGNVISVKSWGGEWMVRISDATNYNYPKRWMMSTSTGSTTEVTPTLVKFAVGDYIGVNGSIATDASWTINANYINNRRPVPTTTPHPLPYPVGMGSTTINCFKAPCPGTSYDYYKNLKDDRGTTKDLDKIIKENIKINKGDVHTYGGVTESRLRDAQTVERVRAMLQEQIKNATSDAQRQELQRAYDRLDISYHVDASSSASTTR